MLPLLQSATHITDDRLHAAMNMAFSDYPAPMQLSPAVFDLMMRSRGLDKGHSKVVIVDGEIAAFWLIGCRGKRAYLISSGTLPAFRKRGLSKHIGQSVIEDLPSSGFESLQSEVLEDNPAARALYRRLGFAETRTLDCYVLPRSPGQVPSAGIETGDVRMIPSSGEQFWDVDPSWQNDTASLLSVADQAVYLAIHDQSGPAAYAAILRETASLAQLAVRKDRRREGLATRLLQHAQTRFGIDPLRILNVDHGAPGCAAFLRALGGTITLSQKELHLPL